MLRSAQQAADRELTAAELALIQAQYRLAEVARLDTSGQLPLPGENVFLNLPEGITITYDSGDAQLNSITGFEFWGGGVLVAF